MKRFIAIILIFILCGNIVFAADKVNFNVGIRTDFSPSAEVPETVEFKTGETVTFSDDVEIPAGAVITAKVCQYQTERRWHKSGFFICKLTSYFLSEENVFDISDKELYLIARKYVDIDKKGAAILSTEIVLTQAASIVGSCFIYFAPVDIAYFFTKGAIIRQKDPNWFKSGVMEAYDNSIFWFQLKGRPIELVEGDSVKLQLLTPEKAEKMTNTIEKRKEKKALKQQRREEKRAKRNIPSV